MKPSLLVLAIAATGLTLAVVLAYRPLTRWADQHLTRLITTALETDPPDGLDTLDHEYQLIYHHQNRDGRCTDCRAPWPCIPLQALGITSTREDA